MPAVFVHGVPDTFRVWDPLRKHLSRQDVVALALPGFNTPLPTNFKATKEEYANWIICQLEEIGEPVDLVGHDWGCILTMRVATLRPDLIRSWAAGSGPVSAKYEWHPLAKIWQTSGEGEKWFKELDPASVAAFMVEAGLPIDSAEEAVSHIDQTMGECILHLYRSALQVGKEWQPDLSKVRSPGLVFWGAQDTACPVEYADELASNAGADRELRLDAGHWIIVERSVQVAEALEAHWGSVHKQLSN